MENGITTQGDMTEKLTSELRAIADQAEDLLEAQGKDLTEKTREIRDRLAGALSTTQETLETLETQAAAGIKAADRAIRSHPYQSIGIALGLGLIAGLLIKRR